MIMRPIVYVIDDQFIMINYDVKIKNNKSFKKM